MVVLTMSRFSRQTAECAQCGSMFVFKLDRAQPRKFCSLTCKGKFYESSSYARLLTYKKPADPFLNFTQQIKRGIEFNAAYGPTNISIDYLKQLWEYQQGVCLDSGVALILPCSTLQAHKSAVRPSIRPSLDRIDSSGQYTRGNVRFISLLANWAKGDMCWDDYHEFCKAVSDYSRGIPPVCAGWMNPLRAFQRPSRKSYPDEHRPFIMYENRSRNTRGYHGRCPAKPSTITAADLKEVWGRQRGICPLTGWKLSLPDSSSGWMHENPPQKYRASLDRIDSSRGYFPDNVRFLSIPANRAKNQHTDADVIELCRNIVKYKGL